MWNGDVSRSAADVLDELHAASLCEFIDTTQRFRLHDLAIDFALAQLRVRGAAPSGQSEESTALLRHAEHFSRRLAAANDLFVKGGENIIPALQRFDRDRANIEAGQAWVTRVMKDPVGSADSEIVRNAVRLANRYPDAGADVLSLRRASRRSTRLTLAAS